MMKKLDIEREVLNKKNKIIPLLSQNISVIEVGGAYANIFEKFIDFLGIKSLVITDIDSCERIKDIGKDGKIKQTKEGKDKEKLKKCPVDKGHETTNSTLNYFYGKPSILDLQKNLLENKTFKKILNKKGDAKEWVEDKDGNLSVIYQIDEYGYNARSFEDAFINLNLYFLKSHKKDFKSLQNKKKLNGNDFYKIAENCLKGKTVFALDILYYSDNKFEDWFIPEYIKEGLLWLQN